jgi:hypothetical protein
MKRTLFLLCRKLSYWLAVSFCLFIISPNFTIHRFQCFSYLFHPCIHSSSRSIYIRQFALSTGPLYSSLFLIAFFIFCIRVFQSSTLVLLSSIHLFLRILNEDRLFFFLVHPCCCLMGQPAKISCLPSSALVTRNELLNLLIQTPLLCLFFPLSM